MPVAPMSDLEWLDGALAEMICEHGHCAETRTETEERRDYNARITRLRLWIAEECDQ